MGTRADAQRGIQELMMSEDVPHSPERWRSQIKLVLIVEPAIIAWLVRRVLRLPRGRRGTFDDNSSNRSDLASRKPRDGGRSKSRFERALASLTFDARQYYI